MQALPPVPHADGAVPPLQTPAEQQPAQEPGPHEPVHAPQSPGHVEHSSVPLQEPSPHVAVQLPQSAKQLEQDSPADGAQVPSPQPAHVLQSIAQLVHDSPSPGRQSPSPQLPGPAFEHETISVEARARIEKPRM